MAGKKKAAEVTGAAEPDSKLDLATAVRAYLKATQHDPHTDAVHGTRQAVIDALPPEEVVAEGGGDDEQDDGA